MNGRPAGRPLSHTRSFVPLYGNQGAPDLSNEGTRGKSKQQLADYIKDPSKFGNNVMPKFGFDDQQLNQLAEFLLVSKGPK